MKSEMKQDIISFDVEFEKEHAKTSMNSFESYEYEYKYLENEIRCKIDSLIYNSKINGIINESIMKEKIYEFLNSYFVKKIISMKQGLNEEICFHAMKQNKLRKEYYESLKQKEICGEN